MRLSFELRPHEVIRGWLESTPGGQALEEQRYLSRVATQRMSGLMKNGIKPPGCSSSKLEAQLQFS